MSSAYNIEHVPVTTAGYAGHLKTAVEQAQDPELLARELARATTVIIPTTGASATTPAAAGAPAPPLVGDQIKALLSKVGTTDSLALKSSIWAALGKFGMQGDAAVADWKPDASVADLNMTIRALHAQLEAWQAPGSPAAAISAAAAAAAATPTPASPGLRKGPGYEARDGGTAHFPCEIMDKQTAVVSYTVKFDNNGETKKVEPAAVRAVTGTRARTATKRPTGCVDPTDPRFNKDVASAARASPSKKRRISKGAAVSPAKGTLNKETRIYTAAEDQTPAMIAEDATTLFGYKSPIQVDVLIAVNHDVPNFKDMRSNSKLAGGTQITIPDDVQLSQAQ